MRLPGTGWTGNVPLAGLASRGLVKNTRKPKNHCSSNEWNIHKEDLMTSTEVVISLASGQRTETGEEMKSRDKTWLLPRGKT